ncbi:hypothetical protein [Burkholderia sp. IDO3]|uniref:hypothetical protein n=1 Tax=Burkholderia sp. IDO3 TaxID=1705310 RepID=UPI000BBAFA81|nr:hypothetical protein [Burkholderia sp. IDO3]
MSRDQEGYSRNDQGGFSDPGAGVGSEYRQSRAGVNYSDTIDSARSKVNYDRFQELQGEYQSAAQASDVADFELAMKTLGRLLIVGFWCLVVFTVYKTASIFVAGVQTTQARVVAAPGYLDELLEYLEAPEKPIRIGLTPDSARETLIDKLTPMITSHAVVMRMVDSCAQACEQPSSAEMLKHVRFVKPAQMQNFLQLACQKNEFNNLYIGGNYVMKSFRGKIVLEPTATGCHVRDYQNVRTVFEPTRQGYLKFNQKDQSKIRETGYGVALKYAGLLAAEVAVLGWWFMRKKRKAA